MIFEIDLTSGTSVYLQLCEQVRYGVASGALQPGDRLPTIRQVATETRVNRNTVARAYAELERQGVIVARPGQGSFIAPTATAIQKSERLRVLEEMLRKVFVEAYHLRIPVDELRTLFDDIATALANEREGRTQ